ncbi:MAG: hydrogenase expression/formation protein HypE [Candidatus Eisenbacteria bacterium]|nr:hydrogenase expression/formation protein HypE [Candidatus Eisenbacteria bacterium]
MAHHTQIVLGHGGGGRWTSDLIRRLFQPRLGNAVLLAGDDSAVLKGGDLLQDSGELALSTDAHIVQPIVFPGGDIGRLSICGTVNDLAMVGARPLWLTAAFILEEGLPMTALEEIVDSMREAAAEAGVAVVAGDTKVAERGKVDRLYITTTGLGRIPEGRRTRGAEVRPGDAVLVSGPLGDHGIAVLSARGELEFETEVRSDVAPLNGLVEAMYAAGAPIHALRDPTRGGLAAALNELSGQSRVGIVLEEEALPVRPAVASACEMLGFDPLQIANEGKLVAFVPEDDADRVLDAMRRHWYGTEAVRIGRVEESPAGRVLMRTRIGGTRIIDAPAGELLPRIC